PTACGSPNDPRGSGSYEVRKPSLQNLGDVHHGRKKVQPPRNEVKHFYKEANPKLTFTPLWFDEATRNLIGKSFADVITARRYTVWACAVLSNHAHLLIRRHRDDGDVMWSVLAESAGTAIRMTERVDSQHPVWADRPYDVFKHTP